MQTTTFNEIPYDWRVPGTYVEVRPNHARRGVLPWPVNPWIIAPKLAAGTAPALVPVEITQASQAAALFGTGSIAHRMAVMFRKSNRTQRLTILPIEDLAGGVQATGTLTFAGAGGSGAEVIVINGVRVRIITATGATPTQRATAMAAAVNALPDLPVTATAAAAVVTLTARHKGECGNAIDVRPGTGEDAAPAGLTITIVAMASGAGNASIQPALDSLVNTWVTDIGIAYADTANLTALAAWLAPRYQAMGKLDCHGYVADRATYGQATTKGTATNSPQLTYLPANRPRSAPWEIAAQLMAVAAFHLTNDPARQLRSLPLPDVTGPDDADAFTELEQDLLLRSGCSVFDMAAGAMVLKRVITTYRRTTLNVADDAWLDIMVPKTLSRIRYDWSVYVTLIYPRSKLADDDAPAAEHSDAVVTPRRMHGSWAARCRLYERQAWIEDAARTISESRFYRPESDRNRLEASQQVRVIGNLMVLAAALEFQV